MVVYGVMASRDAKGFTLDNSQRSRVAFSWCNCGLEATWTERTGQGFEIERLCSDGDVMRSGVGSTGWRAFAFH
jgi:hypothetical protein